MYSFLVLEGLKLLSIDFVTIQGFKSVHRSRIKAICYTYYNISSKTSLLSFRKWEMCCSIHIDWINSVEICLYFSVAFWPMKATIMILYRLYLSFHYRLLHTVYAICVKDLFANQGGEFSIFDLKFTQIYLYKAI